MSLVGGLAPEIGMADGEGAIPWHVIQTHCRTESRVQMALESKGIEAFLPLMVVPKRRRGRKILLPLPLFPGYLFVHAHLDTRVFHHIIKIDGVLRLLGNGAPARVPAEEIGAIRTIVAGERQYYPFN